MATVAIVGAGYMGTATAYPLTDNGHTVRLVGTHLDDEIIQQCRERHYHPWLKRELPAGVEAYYVDEMGEALDGVDIIVSGVSSPGTRWIGPAIGPYLKPDQLIIAITKGLEVTPNGDLLILPDVVASTLPANVRDQVRLAAVGGPCIAGELAGRRQSGVVFGSRDREAVEHLAATFRTTYYHIWTTTDLVGLEVCAALKNAYTLGVGMVTGILERSGGPDAASAYMHNMAAATFAQACTEMDRVLQITGGSRSFAYGLPGAGDLYVTSTGGRTARLGRLLGLGHSYVEAREIMAGETLEAVEIVNTMSRALPQLIDRGLCTAEQFPLMQMLIDLVVKGDSVDFLMDAFFFDDLVLNNAAKK